MANSSTILLNLYKHDLAACEVYKEVLGHIQDRTMHQQISNFLNDHKNHVHALSALLEKITGERPTEMRDLKGVLLSGYATIRSMTGQDGALKALQAAEGVLLRQYQEAAQHQELPDEAKTLINENLQDERRHNDYVNKVLSA